MTRSHGTPASETDARAFEAAAEQRSTTFLGEFWRFLRQNRKWWLTPIIVTLLLVAVLVVVAGSGAGPLVYTLF
ncbi:MAG TPA: DUF5989 family protein [Acidimicrobiales bacterium]